MSIGLAAQDPVACPLLVGWAICIVSLGACSHDGPWEPSASLDLAGAAASPDALVPSNPDLTVTRPICFINLDDPLVPEPVLWDPIVALAAGDFDADGHEDLVGASAGNYRDWAPDRRGVFLQRGRGDGHLGPPEWIEQRFTIAGLLSTDFDGDGRLDLMVIGLTNAEVLRGAGDGTFGALPIVDWKDSTRAAVIGDFNGDGRPDLAVARDSPALVVYAGRGNGTFGPPITLGAMTIDHLAVADLDRNGRSDLVASSGTLVLSFRGRSDGGFEPSVREVVGAGGTQVVSLANLDGDELPDLVFANKPDPFSSHVFVARGRGNGAFASPGDATPVLPDSPWPESMPAMFPADFNGDKTVDLVAVGSPYVSSWVMPVLLPGRGDGTLEIQILESLRPAGYRYLAGTLGDWNGDGHPDIAVSTAVMHPCPDCPDSENVVLLLSAVCRP